MPQENKASASQGKNECDRNDKCWVSTITGCFNCSFCWDKLRIYKIITSGRGRRTTPL